MLCEETREWLSDYVDDELTLPSRLAVDHHLNQCPVCRDDVSKLRNLRQELFALSPVIVPHDLASNISGALMIEAAAKKQSPAASLGTRLALWLEPKLMPYTIGWCASIILFFGMFAGLRPHIVALRQAAAMQRTTIVDVSAFPYDITKPVSSEMFAAKRAPFAESSPSLNPSGALAALTGSYANSSNDRYLQEDDMIVVADVFSNGAASLAGVVQAPRNKQMLDDFEIALRRDAAFVPASMDRRPDTMRVVFTVQKVDVRERNF